MRSLVERLSSAALGIAALVIAGVFVHREFFGERSRAPTQYVSGRVAEWREALTVGRVIGDTGAPAKLIEFSDLECPFCRQFHAVTETIRAKYPGDVAVVLVHTPLKGHRFAEPAARAAECAHVQGKFAAFVSRVFDKQDSLGLKSWVSYGRDAGILDTVSFVKCVASNDPVLVVERGKELAKKLGITGTPTVLLNDWRFGAPPSERELASAIDSLRKLSIGKPN